MLNILCIDLLTPLLITPGGERFSIPYANDLPVFYTMQKPAPGESSPWRRSRFSLQLGNLSSLSTFRISAHMADRTATFVLDNTAALGAGAALVGGLFGVDVITVVEHVVLDRLGNCVGA